MIIEILLFLLSFLITLFSTKELIEFLRKKGIVGIDMHKPSRPKIPTMGGLGILIGVLIPLILIMIFGAQRALIKTLTLSVVVILAAIIGIYDDLKSLGGLTKTTLTVLLVVPIILGYWLYPRIIVLGRPIVPIIGRLRITIIYWLLLPFGIAGAANVVNMLEVMNGIMPITCSLSLLPFLLYFILKGNELGLLLTLILLGSLLAYLPYNKYPAKVFSGNVGSLIVGAYIGGLAIIERVEFIALVALLPHLINAFYIIVSIGGFKEHKRVKERPVIVHQDGVIEANRSPSAPVTLTRLILLAGGAMKEHEIVKVITLVEIWVVILASITVLLYFV